MIIHGNMLEKHLIKKSLKKIVPFIVCLTTILVIFYLLLQYVIVLQHQYLKKLSNTEKKYGLKQKSKNKIP